MIEKQDSIREMYNTNNRIADHPNCLNYNITKKYEYQIKTKTLQKDHLLQKFKPRIQFEDQIIKHGKQSPSPTKYTNIRVWRVPDDVGIQVLRNRSLSPLTPKDQRLTEICQNVNKQRKIKSPGPQSYFQENKEKLQNDLNDDKQHQLVVRNNRGPRTTFLNDQQKKGEEIPGPGEYNPWITDIGFQIRKKCEKIIISESDRFQQKNSRVSRNQKAKSQSPDPGTYKPIPGAYQTFESIKTKFLKQPFGTKKNQKYFGTGKRIATTDKKTRRFPGPGKYNIQDTQTHAGKPKSCFDVISYPITKNIYYQ